MTIHRVPLEPTSDRVPCCGTLITEVPATDRLTRVDRDVTCKPDELADLGMNPTLAAVVDAIRGPRREPMIARLREIKAQSELDVKDTDEPEHGEPGHACIPPEALMQVQDALGNVIRIVEGHKATLEAAGYPEPVVYGMVSNLHAVLLQRLL